MMKGVILAQRFRQLDSRFAMLSEGWQRRLIIGVFILVQIIIWTLMLEILWYGDRSITDTPIYYDYAGRVVSGMFPYRDFASEYPPVAMLLFLLPRLLSGSSYGAFVLLFEAEMLVFSSGIVAMLANLAWRQWHSPKKTALTLALYSLSILAIGAIVKSRFDLAVACLILASITCYVTDRRLLAWILLGVGLMTKIIPVLIAPLFLIIHYRRRQWREMWVGPLVALAAVLVIAAPFLITAPGGLASSFLYHAERPLQLESSWASPLLIMSSFGRLDVDIMNSYGSHNVFSPGSDAVALLSGPVTAIFLAAAYLIFLKSSAAGFSAVKLQEPLIRFSAVAMATFIVGGKVLSPQFIIWLLPLVPLVSGRGRRPALAFFTGVLLLTQWEFPARYWNLFMMETDMIVVVALRNLLLVALVVTLIAGGRKPLCHPERQRSEREGSPIKAKADSSALRASE